MTKEQSMPNPIRNCDECHVGAKKGCKATEKVDTNKLYECVFGTDQITSTTGKIYYNSAACVWCGHANGERAYVDKPGSNHCSTCLSGTVKGQPNTYFRGWTRA